MSMIKLQSSDGEIFDTDTDVIKCSGTIRTMLEEGGVADRDDEASVVPLPNVNAEVLRKVLAWADRHKEDPIPAEDDKEKSWRTDDISQWDAQFFRIDQGKLFELITAANYLDMKALWDTGCKTVANMMKGKPADEIRRIFNITNDLVTQEEEPVGNENA